jgi:peptidoglycan/LPS O-acetylase OafA/YrhL
MTALNSKAQLRTDVQALRGLAVLLVLMHHAGVHLRAGYLGVDIFFVISGFLITGLVKKALERDAFSFTDFYFRRAKRLLPAAYVTFALTGVAALLLLASNELADFASQLVGAVTFTGNVALWRQTNYFLPSADLKPLLHVWSLAIEEQYYLVLPAALVWFPRRLWLGAALACVALSAALSLLLAPRFPSAAFYLLPTRAWELGIGTLGALASHRREHLVRVLFWPAAAALLVVPFFPLGGAHPGVDAAVVCAATLVIVLRRHGTVGESAPARALAWFGDISYSLYLVHWPIFALAHNVWLGPLPQHLRLGLAMLSVVVARLLFAFVEEPARHATIALSRRLVGATVFASVIVVAIPFAGLTSRSGRFGARHANYGLSEQCDYKTLFLPRPECQTDDTPNILVWGDSYAMHLIGAVSGRQERVDVVQATRSMCGPVLGVAPLSREQSSPYRREWAERCTSFNDSVLEYIARTPTLDVVVLSSMFSQYVDGSRWSTLTRESSVVDAHVDLAVTALRTTAERVRALGKRVIVVSPPPRAEFDIGACLERQATGRWTAGPHADCALVNSVARSSDSFVADLLARLPREAGIRVVDFEVFLCGEDTCRTQLDGVPLYRDEGHFSVLGAVALGEQMKLARRVLLEAN